MTKILTTLFLIIPTFWTMGQKLLVENQNGKKTNIQLGSIMTVSTLSDSTNSDPFHYKDSVDTKTSYWCLTGCYKLLAIDTISDTIQIQRFDNLVLNYKVDEIRSISYVRSKHPDRIRRTRLSFITFGLVILIGHTITIGSAESASEKIWPYVLGTAMIGYGLIDRRNEPKKYKLLGLTN